MSISFKTRKMLWGRSGNLCAFPSCHMQLIMGNIRTNDLCIIGEETHIVAKEVNGPRGDSSLTPQQRDEYHNLILLCPTHHELIDNQPGTYTVECLKQMKENHERWVKESYKEFEPQKQNDDEIYAEYVDEWSRLSNLEDWHNWSTYILSADGPSMPVAQYNELQELRRWLFSRIWPGRYKELEEAFNNFMLILRDFMETFHLHSKRSDEFLLTERFYKITDWDTKRYEQLLQEYEFHCELVSDLMLELTRAANYICDRVRQFISPVFRLREGMLLVESGPYIDKKKCGLINIMHRVEYRGEERALQPYPGLNKFKEEREKRDDQFGKGISPKDI